MRKEFKYEEMAYCSSPDVVQNAVIKYEFIRRIERGSISGIVVRYLRFELPYDVAGRHVINHSYMISGSDHLKSKDSPFYSLFIPRVIHRVKAQL